MKEKITTLKALLAVREAERRYLQLRLEDKFSLEEGEQHKNILVCAGTGCTAGDSAILIKKLNEKLEEAGLAEEVKVVKTGCFGFCQKGPIVAVYPDRVYYTHVKPDDAERIVNDHVIGGHVIKDLQMFDTDRKTGEKVYDIDKIALFGTADASIRRTFMSISELTAMRLFTVYLQRRHRRKLSISSRLPASADAAAPVSRQV